MNEVKCIQHIAETEQAFNPLKSKSFRPMLQTGERYRVYEKLDLIKQGAVSERYAKSIKTEIGTLLSEMRKAADFQLFEHDDRGALRVRLASVENAVDAHATKVDGDILESLPARKKTTYQEVFDLIYECSVNQVAAKNLVDRMLARLSRF